MRLVQRLKLAFRVLWSRNGPLVEHAEREVFRLYTETSRESLTRSNRNAALYREICLDIVAQFESATLGMQDRELLAGVLAKLFAQRPLTPLTGNADEWEEVGAGLWRNKRYPFVWKDAAYAWDTNATLCRRPDGVTYRLEGGHGDVKFPYTPRPRYIEVGR
jgi:hypothetical protein